MQTPFIVRLKQPYESPGMENFGRAFGGAAGFSPEAHRIVRQLFETDLMGAHEYEGRTVPMALLRLMEMKGQLLACKFSCEADISKSFGIAAHFGIRETRIEVPVYAISPGNLIGDIVEFVRRDARNDAPELSEPTNFRFAAFRDIAQRPCPEIPYVFDYSGWFDLRNGFMYFIDQPMFTRVGCVLGLDLQPAMPKNGRAVQGPEPAN